jgi:hypothetical protein
MVIFVFYPPPLKLRGASQGHLFSSQLFVFLDVFVFVDALEMYVKK